MRNWIDKCVCVDVVCVWDGCKWEIKKYIYINVYKWNDAKYKLQLPIFSMYTNVNVASHDG